MESNLFGNLILLFVFFNTLTLALDGITENETIVTLFKEFNFVFTLVFTIEMSLKLIGLGIKGYVLDVMNIFDGLIVIISLVEEIFISGDGKSAISAFRTVRIFRTFRVLRVTRLLRSLAFMKVIIGVISRSIKSLMYIALLLFIMIFIYSLLGMQFFGGKFDFDTNGVRQNFDNFFNAFLSVFQITTLENWQQIMHLTLRTTVNKFVSGIYLISWIFIGNYIFLNLFLAILLDRFTDEDAEKDQLEIDEEMKEDEEDEEDNTAAVQQTQQSQSNVTGMNQAPLSRSSTMAKGEHGEGAEQKNADTDDDEDFHEVDLAATPKKRKRMTRAALFKDVACEKSFYLFSKRNKWRVFCMRVVRYHSFENVIIVAIFASSIKLAIETYFSGENGTAVVIMAGLDYFFNVFFALESLFKATAYGLFVDNNSYLRETWNILDFFIVMASVIDMSLSAIDIPFIRVSDSPNSRVSNSFHLDSATITYTTTTEVREP